jgi:hypothetical protein
VIEHRSPVDHVGLDSECASSPAKTMTALHISALDRRVFMPTIGMRVQVSVWLTDMRHI